MLSEVLEKYLKLFPADSSDLGLLIDQLENKEKLIGRDNYTGHVTGTAIILSPDLRKLLLIYHPTMQRWQPPGGHWDEGEPGPWLTAEREAGEETGVVIEKRINVASDIRIPLHIDSHVVPKRPPKNEPQHYHHDFRYAFIASSEELKYEDDVIQEAKWQACEDIELPNAIEAISRVKQLLKLNP